MRQPSGQFSGLTMVEMMTALAIGSIVLLVGWSVWEMTWRGVVAARAEAEAARGAFNALQRIEQEVQRGMTLQTPDPAYPNLPSILVTVPTTGNPVRRAFRLVNGNLIVDLKDEGVAPYPAFSGITNLTFNILNAPVNSQVEIVCTCVNNGRSNTMRTVAFKRN